MTTKLLLAGAAFAMIALPAMAQTPGQSPAMTAPAGTDATVATPPVNPDPMAPPAAETGTAANTSTMATEADLKTGATVKDASGMEIGKIAKVTKGKSAGAAAQVTLSADGKTVAVPASSLSVAGGALVSSESKADIWGAPK